MRKREALEQMVEYTQSAACHNQDGHVAHYLRQIITWGNAALTEPLRNCAIGTAEEQSAEWLDEIKREALHYLEQGTDCFTISAGPWTLTFDDSKESEVK